jgi:methionyl-tRNA formyltransferase
VKILFWGTPEFALSSLRALDDEGFDVVGVVTQPDRPAGRGRRLTPSPVKAWASEQEYPVLTPERPRGEDFMAEVRALDPDVSVVVAYGHILKREVLELPRMGSINVHASLLPELRGAAPINWAIARGNEESGVTVMRMVEAMDAGPIIHQVREPILSDETAGELTMRLAELGAAALVEALALLGGGVAQEIEQDHAAATYAPKIDRDAARIVWGRTAPEVAAHVRAMDPTPGAWSRLGTSPVKLFRPVVWSAADVSALGASGPQPNGGARRAPDGTGPSVPGEVLLAHADEGVVVATGDGAVAFAEAQPPGKRRMSASDWINGRGVAAGQHFG